MSAVHDDLAIAEWFCRSNPWLGGRVPAKALQQDGMSVLHAAQADSLVANR